MTKYEEAVHYVQQEYSQNMAALADAEREIEAHEHYARNNGGRCVVSVALGKVTAWVADYETDNIELSQPVKWIASKPVFYDRIGDITINVTGK